MICSGKVVDVSEAERLEGKPTPQVIRVQFESKMEVLHAIKCLEFASSNWESMRDGKMWGRAVVTLDSNGREHRLELAFTPKDQEEP